MPQLSASEIERLRDRHYNAELIEIIPIHDDLRILRVRPDHDPPAFEAGQYTTLGLGNWEPRVDHVDEEHLTPEECEKLVRRAYSYSCPMLSATGSLLPPELCEYLEFYVALVRHAADHPPGLTPRLFALQAGSRLHLGSKSTGHYTLRGVAPDDNVLMIATGTGEAPHTAMTAELLYRRHRGRIGCVTCVRRRRDLAYLDTFRRLESLSPQLRYLTLTTREPENVDPAVPGYVGKRYLQDYLTSGSLEHDLGWALDPVQTRVFLCGNPSMIGAPARGVTGPERFPKPVGMIELLEGRGFQADELHAPGNVHYEKYW